MNADIAVSIINYRTGEMTIAAVQSVRNTLSDAPARIVVVDNASGDGSADQIAEWMETLNDPRLSLVRSQTNSGFSGGHNQGMAAAPGADFYLILNSDALLRADFFPPLLAAAEAEPKVGLIAPQLEWEDETPQISTFRFAGPASEMMRAAQTGPLTKLLKRHVHAIENPPDPAEIEWASFACILLRGEMVRALGPMDEGYFLYFEDSEYGLRARRAGWGVRYVPTARAVHFRGGSSSVKKQAAAKRRVPAYFWRSRTRFLRQAHGPLGPLWANLAWIAGRGVAWLRVFTGRTVPQTSHMEWRDIWRGFLSPLKPDRAPE